MKTALQAAIKIFGKNNFKVTETSGFLFETKFKIVVFVPLRNADELTFAMASGGAGLIGNYSICSFRSEGSGTFLGGKGTKPAIGKKGKFEIVEEVKLEMLCRKEDLADVTKTIYETHPYEEPAFEVHELLVPIRFNGKALLAIDLKKNVTVKDVVSAINSSIKPETIPAKLKNTKIKQAVINFTESGSALYSGFKKNTLIINRNRNILNIEII